MTTTTLRIFFRRAGMAALVLATVASCTKPSLPGDLKVTDITTGRALAPDGSIAEDARTSMFWSADTFYVSVQTEGSAENVTMEARWTGPAGTKAEVSKKLSPKGTTITSFESPPPKDGKWTDGDYKVEILVNGISQGTRELNART
jgi:hypothetical protein